MTGRYLVSGIRTEGLFREAGEQGDRTVRPGEDRRRAWGHQTGNGVDHIRVEKAKWRGDASRRFPDRGLRRHFQCRLQNTFLTLLDRQEIPPRWFHAVDQAKQTGSILQVCLGVDKSQVDLSCFHERAADHQEPGGCPSTAGVEWNKVELILGHWRKKRWRSASGARRTGCWPPKEEPLSSFGPKRSIPILSGSGSLEKEGSRLRSL